MKRHRIIAELVDACNLRCALCWNRNRTGSGKQMSLETAAKILKRYDNPMCEIAWYNWGEPLLHKELETLAEMIGKSDARTIVSSSMSLPISDERLESLHNFDYVCFSLSGMTSDVYNIYHVGGDLGLVMNNLDRLSKLKLNNVKLRWLEHKYNSFQLPLAQDFANSLGFGFSSTKLNCEVEDLVGGFNHELLKVPKFPRKEHFCHIQYWDAIDVNGNYLLCCASHNVEIGYSVDDKVSRKELRKARSKTDLCATCRENEFWRMF